MKMKIFLKAKVYDINQNKKPVALVGPLIDNNRQGRRKHRDGRTGDRRIDNDSNNRNSSKNSEKTENNYSDDDYGYYDDYEKVLNDYYAGDYDEEPFNSDDSSITEESEEELPTITRTPRTPTKVEDGDNRKTNENTKHDYFKFQKRVFC